MGIFSKLFSNSATLKEPEWWRQTLGSSLTNAGVVITPENAMTLTGVYSSVRIISESIASLPIVLYERDGDSNKPAINHPLYTLLHSIPNPVQTSFEMLEFGMANLLLRGNMYNHALRNNRGRVISITPLKAAYMKVENSQEGLVFNYQEPNNTRIYKQSEIWRTAGLGSDGVVGMSPIQNAKQSLGIGMAAEQYGATVYNNGAQVPAVLETDSSLTDEQYESLRKQWTDTYGGIDNAFKTAILEGGLKYKKVGLSLEDAQFVVNRKMQIAEIARIYRVPLHMLSELDKATFSNIEQQSIEFVTHTIRPWLVRLEQSMNRDLLLPSERSRFYFKFKVEGLLRGDTQSRYASYGLGIRDGWMTRNQARVLEDMDPAPGLDEFILPLNMAEQPTDGIPQNIRQAEIKALKIEAARLDDDQFKDWSVGFYSRVHDMLTRDGVRSSVATEYCTTRKQQIAQQENITDFINGINHE